MNKRRKALSVATAAVVILLTMLAISTVVAQEGSSDTVVTVNIQSTSITWIPLISSIKGSTLTISGPGEFYLQKEYEGGINPSIASGGLGDGVYTYEIILWPDINPEDDSPLRGINSASNDEMIQSGAFTVLKGSFVTETIEPGQAPEDQTRSPNQRDVVYADDLIVQQSLCVGFDCINGENFGFDTIRLKENNTRIKFDDTSTSAGFPFNDWTIVANDSASGGASYLAFEDVTGGKFPFKVMAGAPTNSLFVNSNGKLGLGTSTPVLNMHINYGDTPAIRLEQNGSIGWTPQTWDVAGNEANFFIRDVTNGSKLPFRIKPGAPESSLTIQSTGNVGVGTWAPTYNVEIERTNENASLGVQRTDGATLDILATDFVGMIRSDAYPLQFWVNGQSVLNMGTNGNIGIGTAAPYFNLDVKKTGFNASIGVQRTDGAILKMIAAQTRAVIGTQNDFPIQFWVNNTTKMTLASDGSLTVVGPVNATAFNVTSDRYAKENFAPIDSASVLERLSTIPISTWNFTDNDNKTLHMGPMAQDFYAAFGLGADEKHISTIDADGVAFAAIQELNIRNTELTAENASLRAQLDNLTRRVSALEGGNGTFPGQPNQLMIFIGMLLVCTNLGLGAALVWSIQRSKAR